MQRSPSMEFKDLTKKDAQISLSTELDKLMMTSPAGVRDQVEQNMEGFKRLFGKFITSKGPSVQWERIEKLPQDAVSRAKRRNTSFNLMHFHRRAIVTLWLFISDSDC